LPPSNFLQTLFNGKCQALKVEALKAVTVKPSKDQTKAADAEQRQNDMQAIQNGTLILSQRFADAYTIGELLGDGAFGFVFTATRKSDHKEVFYIFSNPGGRQVYIKEEGFKGKLGKHWQRRTNAIGSLQPNAT
jgi:hypothetical protein